MTITYVKRIHRRLCVWFLANLIATSIVSLTALAQQYLPAELQSLDTQTDPRGITMGESFVAVHSPTSMMYNPAGIAGLHGASFSFARRNLDHVETTASFKYLTFSGTLETPYVNLGLLYSRFMQGEIAVSTANSPEGAGKVVLADYVLGLTAARSLIHGLDVGLAIKTFRIVTDVSSGDPPTFNSNTPLLLDIGLIYSYSNVLAENSGNFTLSAGASLQNFGTDFRPEASASGGLMPSQSVLKLPRYLRCGFAFSTTISPSTEAGLVPFALLVSGEYRNFLNGPVDNERSFWGVGGEVTLFEMITGRIGGYIQPYRSIYGDRGDPYLRLGLGIALPLARFNVDSPLVFTFDYGLIPLNTRIPFFYVENTALHVFSIGVRYDNPIF